MPAVARSVQQIVQSAQLLGGFDVDRVLVTERPGFVATQETE